MNIFGVKGYLTPDNLPEGRHCRTFRIPDDVQWLSVFMGALYPLVFPENWQMYGELTPEESADEMLNVIWDGYEQDEGVCPVVETPYWDAATDANATIPEGEPQNWYGILVGESTWQEQIEDWAIAAFLLYSGEPAAAIQFLTIAPRFRLLFKQNDIGGIVRVFVNDVLAWTGDTSVASANGLIQADIFADKIDPDMSEWTLWVEQSGDVQIQVLRKELTPAEIYDPRYRYNPDSNIVQFSSDGITWVDTPQADPRTATSNLLPPNIASDQKCKAAANIVRWLEDFISGTLVYIAEGLDATSLLAIAATFFFELGPFAILIDVILGLCLVMVSAGADAISAAFTPEIYDQLRCIFDCHLEANGYCTADDLASIRADINANVGGLVATILNAIFDVQGFVGVSNAGAMGDAPADCSGCNCNWGYAWTASELSAWTINTGIDTSEGVAPNDVHDGADCYRYVNIQRAGFDSTISTLIGVRVSGFKDVVTPSPNIDYIHAIDGGTAVLFTRDANTDDMPMEWSGSQSVDELQVQIVVGFTHDGTCAGSGLISEIYCEGEGTFPPTLTGGHRIF